MPIDEMSLRKIESSYYDDWHPHLRNEMELPVPLSYSLWYRLLLSLKAPQGTRLDGKHAGKTLAMRWHQPLALILL